jgi:hypothetical protein
MLRKKLYLKRKSEKLIIMPEIKISERGIDIQWQWRRRLLVLSPR